MVDYGDERYGSSLYGNYYIGGSASGSDVESTTSSANEEWVSTAAGGDNETTSASASRTRLSTNISGSDRDYAVSSVEIEGSRDRIESLLDGLPPWMPKDKSNNEALLQAPADELDGLSKSIDAVDFAQNVQTAQNEQLDKLAPLVEISRHEGERDELFRSRILVGFLANVSSGTIPDLQEAVSTVLDIPKDEITILEWYDVGRDATITIDVPDGALTKRNITDTQFIDIIKRIVAAGITMRLHRSLKTFDQFVAEDLGDPQNDEVGLLYWDVGRWEVDVYG